MIPVGGTANICSQRLNKDDKNSCAGDKKEKELNAEEKRQFARIKHKVSADIETMLKWGAIRGGTNSTPEMVYLRSQCAGLKRELNSYPARATTSSSDFKEFYTRYKELRRGIDTLFARLSRISLDQNYIKRSMCELFTMKDKMAAFHDMRLAMVKGVDLPSTANYPEYYSRSYDDAILLLKEAYTCKKITEEEFTEIKLQIVDLAIMLAQRANAYEIEKALLEINSRLYEIERCRSEGGFVLRYGSPARTGLEYLSGPLQGTGMDGLRIRLKLLYLGYVRIVGDYTKEVEAEFADLRRNYSLLHTQDSTEESSVAKDKFIRNLEAQESFIRLTARSAIQNDLNALRKERLNGPQSAVLKILPQDVDDEKGGLNDE